MAEGPRVRIRTAVERKKALAQLTELRMSGQLARSVIIAELKNGDFIVLGQEMAPHEIPRAICAATMGLQAAEETRHRLTREPLEYSVALGGESSPGERIRPKITKDAQGTLVPPDGENFISCPVCTHPRYYVTAFNDEQMPHPIARLSCAHCGNEVAFTMDEPGL